jgi:hypothetical protein
VGLKKKGGEERESNKSSRMKVIAMLDAVA